MNLRLLKSAQVSERRVAMAATVNTERIIEATVGGGPRPGNGFHKNGGNGSGRDGSARQFTPSRYRIGTWAGIAGVMMLFTALASAYIVRSASGDDWRPIAMPKVLWLSTALILISSVTMEVSRRALRQNRNSKYGSWLIVTVAIGLAFVASQLVAWRQLLRQGVYMASNPHSSFFYPFTAAHGVHVMGGLMALTYLIIVKRKKRGLAE